VTVAAQIAKRVPGQHLRAQVHAAQQVDGHRDAPGPGRADQGGERVRAKNTANGELNKLYQKWLQADLPKMQ
jgi:polar amino acid transport system substrate-binding protein